MGMSHAALHLECKGRGNLPDHIADAFRSIGWLCTEDAPSDVPARRIAVHPVGKSAFATITIAENDRIDDGSLKELAVILSRSCGTPTVVTNIADSDDFDILLYHSGQQVDALGEAATDPDTDLKLLSASVRADIWAGAFRRTLGPVPDLCRSVFAEDAVASVLSWIGHDPGIALMSYDETVALRASDNDIAMITVIPAPASQNPRGREMLSLEVFHDDDDCPHHRVYPAEWPLPVGEKAGLKWLIVSSGAGFNGARIGLHIDEVSGGDIQLTRLSLHAYPFFNGQIMSGSAVTSYDTTVSMMLENGEKSFEVPSFAMPDLDPETRKRLIIVMRLEFFADQDATVRVRPQFKPAANGAEILCLPPVRLIGTRPSWHPASIRDDKASCPFRQRLLLEINTPSVLSFLVVLDGDTDALRASMKQAAEQWLELIDPPAECNAVVLTKKHMTASGNITKKRMQLPSSELALERTWPRWFDNKTNLHSLRIELRPGDAFQPYAGFILQSALVPDDLAPEQSAENDAALHVAFWMIDHPEAWQALGVDRSEWLAALEDWIETLQPLQAHRGSTAWIPVFDAYEQFEQTIYEDLSGVDWFRLGLQGKLMTRSWCRKTLRFVAPKMWLCDDLVKELSLGARALDGVADVSRVGAIWRFSLRDGAPIATLERAISPILPGAH